LDPLPAALFRFSLPNYFFTLQLETGRFEEGRRGSLNVSLCGGDAVKAKLRSTTEVQGDFIEV